MAWQLIAILAIIAGSLLAFLAMGTPAAARRRPRPMPVEPDAEAALAELAPQTPADAEAVRRFLAELRSHRSPS